MAYERKRSNSDSEEDGDFEDWASEDQDVGVPSFLPPHAALPSATQVWEELRMHTGFDYFTFKSAAGLTPHAAVRLVNYLRQKIQDAEKQEHFDLKTVVTDAINHIDDTTFTDERWLKPVIEDDGLIMAAIDDDSDDESDDASASPTDNAMPSAHSDNKEGATHATSLEEANVMIAALREQLAQSRAMMAALNEDSSDDEVNNTAALLKKNTFLNPTSTGITAQDNDTYYFDSYAQIGIHRDMLKDKVRTEAYRDALLSHDMSGKSVIDVGCGTGILSMFAAKAGAKRVIALDASGIIKDATEIVAQNGLSEVVKPIQGLAERVDLTDMLADAAVPGKVDVLVSEWMGYALLYESMLNSVLLIRDKYLKPGGTMFPSTAEIHLAGIVDKAWWADKVAFWDNVYGFNMHTMTRHIFQQPFVEVIAGSSVSKSTLLAKLELSTMHASEQDLVRVPFTIPLDTSTKELYGLALWFDVGFPHPSAAITSEDDAPPLEDVDAGGAPVGGVTKMTTSPHDTPTHWMQTCLLFNRVLDSSCFTDKVTGHLSMTRDAVNPREYRFLVEVSKDGSIIHSQSYHMH